MDYPTLSSPRLTLRVVTPEGYNHALENLNDLELMEFFGTDEAGIAKEKFRYNGGLVTFNRSFVSFYIIENASNKVIGWCGFHTWYTEHNRAEIGYFLNDDLHKQKGYMSEVLPVVLAYGFEQMNLHRVEALLDDNNVGSKRLLQKNGFVYEGCLREHYYVDGVPDDSVIYGLLKHEFKAIP